MNRGRMWPGVWLAVGTVFPFLLFFALPLFGLTEGLTLTAAKVAVLVFHVVILIGHRRGATDESLDNVANREECGIQWQVSPIRIGFAIGTGLGLAYLSCAVLMAVLPREVAARFFNSVFHCLDVEPLLRWEMPVSEMLLGVVSVVIIGWLFAAVVAGLYNLAAWRPSRS